MAITLLEGFEATPLVSMLTWVDGLGILTVSRTTSHVTEGTYTWRLQEGGSASNFFLGTGSALGTATVDISAYTSLIIDLYAQTTPIGNDYSLVVFDNTFSSNISVSTPTSFTGATTLTLDLTTAGFSLADVIIGFGPNLGASATPSDVYIDNLRADDGAGGVVIPVFYNHMKTQGMA